MKAIFEFNLDKPEDRGLHRVMLNSMSYRSAIIDIKQRLRAEIKHGESKEVNDFASILQKALHDEVPMDDVDVL